jgi:hypothetical protein
LLFTFTPNYSKLITLSFHPTAEEQKKFDVLSSVHVYSVQLAPVKEEGTRSMAMADVADSLLRSCWNKEKEQESKLFDDFHNPENPLFTNKFAQICSSQFPFKMFF